MNIEIDYNTVSFEAQINCNDATILNNLNQTIEDCKNKRITDWFETFIRRAKEESNNDPFSIQIKGCDFYEKAFIDSVLENEANFIDKKRIDFLEDNVIKNEYKNIDDFLDYAIKSEEPLVKDAIKPNIENFKVLRGNKVEVPVIATMSSGKSTLLNALIGQDFLFEDTGAATATTCNIKVNNELKKFVAQAIDGETIIEESNIDISKFLERWNSSANKTNYSNLRLNIEGPVKNLSSSELELNFIDTPGPNSAQYKNHKGKTFHYLKDNQNLPIVLYVLDPEKMESEDDDKTLEEISNVLNRNKQNLDRIIFIYNKIDREELDKKPFSEVLLKIHKFLGKYKIENPKVFPVSAKYAKLAQLNDTLSRNDKSDLAGFRYKFIPNSDESYEGYQLLDHTPLYEVQKKLLRQRISKSELDSDLVHSGIAAIKLYIEDYIFNHHQKNQYRDIIGIANKVSEVLKNKIELEKINLDEKTTEEQYETKQRTQEEIEELTNRKVEALQAIGKIELDDDFIQEALKDIDTKFNTLKNKSLKKNNLNIKEAEYLIEEAGETILNLLVSIETDLFSKMNDEGSKYLKKLKNEVANKFELKNPSLEIKTFNAEILNNINVIDINSIDRNKKTKVETKQKNKTKKVKSKNWFKRMLGIEDIVEYTVPYTVTKIEVEAVKLYDEAIDPISKRVFNIVKDTRTEFDNMFREYNASFQHLVNTSFDQAINSVYKNSQQKLAVSIKDKEIKIQKLDEIIKPISKFKIKEYNERIYRKPTITC